MEKETYSILIVDDHQMFIDGIQSLLIGQNKYLIKHEANDGQTALDILSNNEVDVLISDLSMPGMSGTELVKIVKENYHDIKVIVLSMHNNRETVGEILMSEAEGYILKNTGKKELLNALDRITEGSTFYSKEVMSLMLEKIEKQKQIVDETECLTERELEILQLIVQEFSSEEIADQLFISKRTVDTHRKHILKKTKSKTIVGLIKFAFRNELVVLV
ncbi:two component transcriptional regulator, LuxR family [Reichenbachiella faecimaris]|uniref:Two component transcriptional regulator, LuxR family n=1 Tax=Reichenbachiella faecimaris TaxID=692418 RepID=A0A1W2G8P3_REIFA|nr:response regulator transcription factor [Reichenbachiella faecimaris]SMD33049.1 two component transcriptional regulator, LuxR family [Reichenbachiella faecimaris]